MSSILQAPGRIGRLTLKNRVIMAPLGTNYGTTDGLSTERDKLYYAERARGGVALIMTEAMIISANARQHNNSLLVNHDRFIPGLASVVKAIKDAGALAVGQISHRGGLLRRSVLNMEPVGPSPWMNPNTGDPVRSLAVDEIVKIEEDYVAAARRMAEAGYDGVEIHAANGYLFQQFFSPRINKRTDQYGGSLVNRMRFLVETVCRVKEALPEFPLFVRFGAAEFVDGGYTQADAIELAKTLEAIGVDALDLSGGTNESHALSRYCIQPPSFPRGCLQPYAKPIRDAVSIPVIVAGRLITPADAEGMLTSGSADFVSLGRALVADAYWCAKAFGQVPTPIRACISCNVCFERLTRERDMSCVQNPLVGTEFEAPQFAEPHAARAAPHPASARAPRILILGAGVSGIEAARMLAGFGHTVEVWESSDQVGGQMPLALAAPFKDDVTAVWSYRWDQVRQLDVPVKIAAVANAQSIAAARPDHVIVATGSRPRKPLFEVPPPIRSLQAWDVLRTPAIIESGETLVIVGGGMVGIETADLLIGRGCRITVIEQTAVVAKEMAQNNRVDVLLRLAESDVALLTETMITGIENGSVLADTRGETRRISGVDGLIWAIGPEPNRDIVPVLERLEIPHSLIGDCNQVGDFLSGIRDASLVALMLAERFRARGDIPKTSVAVADMGIESAYKF